MPAANLTHVLISISITIVSNRAVTSIKRQLNKTATNLIAHLIILAPLKARPHNLLPVRPPSKLLKKALPLQAKVIPKRTPIATPSSIHNII